MALSRCNISITGDDAAFKAFLTTIVSDGGSLEIVSWPQRFVEGVTGNTAVVCSVLKYPSSLMTAATISSHVQRTPLSEFASRCVAETAVDS